MLETMVICVIFGYIIGSCATILLILFLMAACPDTPQKMREDWEGLKEWVGRKRHESMAKDNPRKTIRH